MIMGERLIQHGEITMILMNIFGELLFCQGFLDFL